MKRWVRTLLTFALLLSVVWCVRAAYLFRVWQMAQLWANVPNVAPPISAFFAPGTWATTRHGVYADAVFLRLSMSDRPFASRLGTIISTPQTRTDGCDATNWRRNYPPHITPHNLVPCYGLTEAFGTPNGSPLSSITETGRGGTVWRGDTNTVYIIAYQTR